MIKRKKALLGAIVAVTFGNAVGLEASAYQIELVQERTNVKMEVNTYSLNVRRGPSTKYGVMGSVKKGTKLDVISISKGWAKINYNGRIGYVSASYLKKVTPVVKIQMTAKVGDLNVRKGSSTKYAILGKLNKGDKVTVVKTLSNGWVKIEYKNGFGYVSNIKGAYLEESTTPEAPVVKKQMVAKVDDLNVRKGSSTKYSILGKLNKGDEVTVVETLSNGWVKIEYKNGFGYVSNVKGAYLEESTTVEDRENAQEVISVIAEIEAISEIDLSNSDLVRRARMLYDNLSPEAKDMVSPEVLAVLEQAEDKIAELEKEQENTEESQEVINVIAEIEAIAEIDLSNADLIRRARMLYDNLSPEAKDMIAPEVLAILEGAEEKIAELEKEQEYIEASQEVIDVIAEIEAIAEIDLSNADLIRRARMLYDNLSPEAKDMVSPEVLAVLEGAEEKIAELEKEQEDTETSQEVINVIAEIEAIADIDLSNADLVRRARMLYDNLSPEAKDMVSPEALAVLEQAEDKITELEEKVTNIESKIDALQEDVNKDNYSEIRTALDEIEVLLEAIGEVNHSNIENMDKYNTVEEKVSAIESDVADAERVNNLIEALKEVDDITIDDKDTIENAVSEYEALSDFAKTLISPENLTKLAELEGRLAELEEEARVFTVEEVKELVESLPTKEDTQWSHGDDIEYARQAFNKLDSSDQALVDNISKLDELEAEWNRINDGINAVTTAIHRIPALEDLTIADKQLVVDARNAYDSADDKITHYVNHFNVGDLLNAEIRMEKLEGLENDADAQDLVDRIKALNEKGDITIDDKDTVSELRATYNGLQPESQKLIYNLYLLLQFEEQIEELENA